MNWKIILAALIVSGGIAFLFFSFKKKGNPQEAENAPSQPNPYEGLKRLAYSTTYEQLHLPEAGGKEVLYGVLMDWDYEGKAIITLVSFRTGDASLYFSTGAVIIGGGQHGEVAETSKVFINQAESLLSEANSADTALRAEPGMLKFYLLTTKGKYTIKDKIDNVYNRTSKLSGLFTKANELISAVRKVTPER
jgi:hypothetical protein